VEIVTEPRRNWTEDETRLALFLYFQLPFGQLHSGNPEVQKLASILGRTHSSVAMKLCNFASLDPKITETGRKGLRGASAQDKRIWQEFHDDWTGQIEKTEIIWGRSGIDLDSAPKVKEYKDAFVYRNFEGETTKLEKSKRRVGQEFFRRSVLSNFEYKCCITGISEPSLLNASHIIPWGVDIKNRHNPANGLSLSATFDRAFDRGLIAIADDYTVIVSRLLVEHTSFETRSYFKKFHEKAIIEAHRFDPQPYLLAWHRSEVFQS
jgi:putative restriction endonuclease